jgi:hypothetical protein
MKTPSPSLKALIADELMASKIMSFEDLKQLAEKNGYKVSNAERRLRNGDVWDLPVIKLNAKRKPISGSERIYFYKWAGGKTIFKD